MTTQEIALEILVALIRGGHTARYVDEAVCYSVTGAKLLQELTKSKKGETKLKCKKKLTKRKSMPIR